MLSEEGTTTTISYLLELVFLLEASHSDMQIEHHLEK